MQMLRIFRLLENGEWHTLGELAEKTKIQLDELTKYCIEASQKGLVDYDPKTAKVRLGHNMMSVLLQLNTQNQKQAQWERKGAGTTIIPPNKSLRIQGLRIQNQTESDLKIEFTYKTIPKEIIISNA
jgi:hypothetical protein